jgi:hypothetical protein
MRLMTDLGVLRDKNGSHISAPIGGYNPQTEWAALIGFKPNDLQKRFDLSEQNQAERDYVQFRSTMLLKQFDEFLMALERARVDGKDLTEEQKRQFRVDRQVQIDALEPEVRIKVLRSFRQRLEGRRAGNSQLDRQQQRYWDNATIKLVDDGFQNPIRQGTGIISDDTRIIQVSPPKQEDK